MNEQTTLDITTEPIAEPTNDDAYLTTPFV